MEAIYLKISPEAEMVDANLEHTPENRLWACVVLRALLDAINYSNIDFTSMTIRQRGYKLREAQELIDWFADEEIEVGTFLYACQAAFPNSYEKFTKMIREFVQSDSILSATDTRSFRKRYTKRFVKKNY